MIRFPEVPPIEVALIDRPDQPLMGAGEASLAPVGGALANAIFDATGKRLRTFLHALASERLHSRSPIRVAGSIMCKASFRIEGGEECV